MTNQEMAILNEFDNDIKIVLINNGALGMVKQWQDKFYSQRFLIQYLLGDLTL